MPVRLEAGTLNTHGLAGLLAGVRYLMEEERRKEFQEKRITSCGSFLQGTEGLSGISFTGIGWGLRAGAL